MEGDFLKVLKKLNNGMYQIPCYNTSCNGTPNSPSSPYKPQPVVTKDPNYLQGYLNTLIGSYVKIEFILGTNMFIDKEGVIKEVGIDYVVLESPQTGDLTVADMYSIKFVEVF